MGTPQTDDEIRARCRDAIARGDAMTTLLYQMTRDGLACDPNRLRRLWLEVGGTIREKRMLYAAGCGPMDR